MKKIIQLLFLLKTKKKTAKYRLNILNCQNQNKTTL